jgi:ketosteroid isomerase-like protein
VTPRELFDRALACIDAGDAEGLLALYAEDAALVGLDRTLVGREALRGHVEEWLGRRPRLRELAYAEGPDVIAYQATDGEVRVYGTLLLRDGRIARETIAVAGREPGPGGTGGAGVALEAYQAWEPRPVPDPRTAGREALMPVVMEIVEREGPVLAARAFGLYTRASGGRKLTSAARAPLTGAAWRLHVAGRLEIARAGATTIDPDDVLRAAGAPAVRVRELGPRTLEEVPLDEVAELMRRLAADGHRDLPRAVLDAYGLVRLTARAEEYLGRASALLSGG